MINDDMLILLSRVKTWQEKSTFLWEPDSGPIPRKSTPAGAQVPIIMRFPYTLFSNIYMRRFIVGWKVLGCAQQFKAHIVNYADDLVVLGKAPSTEMRRAFESLMQRLKLTVNAEKTRCCRVPEESIEFLGYRIGRNYRRDTGRAYIGTRPSQASVQRICRRVSEVTETRYGLLEPEVVVGRLNRLITGWANYFCLGQVRIPEQSDHSFHGKVITDSTAK